ncbi:hypothetical protein ANCDUO_07258 [Ancylostoma duodenale]|uniref:Uncharacterized protein n=1 Tax=Ancylostoma duodenale TaxID=51022 RepID=A0A0C2GZB8_9BILA|nr:hypothetical protein ANCDUO_07258 [Ancylostoma duodenale]
MATSRMAVTSTTLTTTVTILTLRYSAHEADSSYFDTPQKFDSLTEQGPSSSQSLYTTNLFPYQSQSFASSPEQAPAISQPFCVTTSFPYPAQAQAQQHQRQSQQILSPQQPQPQVTARLYEQVQRRRTNTSRMEPPRFRVCKSYNPGSDHLIPQTYWYQSSAQLDVPDALRFRADRTTFLQLQTEHMHKYYSQEIITKAVNNGLFALVADGVHKLNPRSKQLAPIRMEEGQLYTKHGVCRGASPLCCNSALPDYLTIFGKMKEALQGVPTEMPDAEP